MMLLERVATLNKSLIGGTLLSDDLLRDKDIMKKKQKTVDQNQSKLSVYPRMTKEQAQQNFASKIGKTDTGANEAPFAEFEILAARVTSLYRSFGVNEFITEARLLNLSDRLPVVISIFDEWAQHQVDCGRLELIPTCYDQPQYLQSYV